LIAVSGALEGAMNWISPYAIVFAGAGFGGVLRHALNNAIPKALGLDYPWATPIINVTGSAAMGLLVGYLAFKDGENWTQHMRLFIATGILGGYTTFSTFSLETVLLIERHAYGAAAAYVFGSVLCGIGGLFAALMLMRSL
jgi:fluoride exporter